MNLAFNSFKIHIYTFHFSFIYSFFKIIFLYITMTKYIRNFNLFSFPLSLMMVWLTYFACNNWNNISICIFFNKLYYFNFIFLNIE